MMIDHIGIAVKNIAEALGFWEQTLGINCTGIEEVEDQKVKTAFLPVENSAELELLEATDNDSSIAKFIAKNNNRGGIHHIALRVDDIDAALADLKAKGVRLIDETPRKGVKDSSIAFIHPSATGGVLLELVQH